MTRGNQREIDRQRAANRNASKGTKKEGDHIKRKENDAAALAAKVEAKRAREAAIASGEIQPNNNNNKKGGKKK